MSLEFDRVLRTAFPKDEKDAEIERLTKERDIAKSFHDLAIADRNLADLKIASLKAELAETRDLLYQAREWLPAVGDGAVRPSEIDPLCDAIDAAREGE